MPKTKLTKEKCVCPMLSWVAPADLERAKEKRHHRPCRLFKTEKHPRLFYFEEAYDVWMQAPERVYHIINTEHLDVGDTSEIRFKCVAMTDAEIEDMPEL